MMFNKKLLVSLFLIFFSLRAFAQNYNTEYWDSLVIFQLRTSEKIIESNNNIVDKKEYYWLSKELKDISILEMRHLHPSIEDEALIRTYQIKIAEPEKVTELINILNKKKNIEYAELLPLHRKSYIPNDQLYTLTNQWGLFKINAEQAWDIATGDTSVVVAVTDDAFDVFHPDLQNVLLPGWDAYTSTPNPGPCGVNKGNHGTHVAGTVGAQTNNGIGLASIGFGIKILPIKIGDCASQYLPASYAGVIYAADNNADIINMSWGSNGGGAYGQNVMIYAWNRGCILVAAAGNDNTSQYHYPSNYNYVIAVASTDQNDNKSSFSNYGTWIDISAPGTNIASTYPDNKYVYMSGTSMATPLVSGLLGLMKSYDPTISNSDLIQCLFNSADPMNNYYYNNNLMGHGRINAQAALNCLSVQGSDLDIGINSILSPVGSTCLDSLVVDVELKNYGSITVNTATINYSVDNVNYTYNWTGSLASGESDTITLTGINLTAGSYTLEVETSLPNGQADENIYNDNKLSYFTLIARPNVSVEASKLEICEGGSVILSASGAGYYSWSPSNLVSYSMGTNTTAYPNETTTFRVIGTGECGTDTAEIQIIVHEKPSVTSVVLNGNLASLNLEAGETVKWYFNNNLIGTSNPIELVHNGEYTAVIENEHNCSVSIVFNFDGGESVNVIELNKNSIAIYPNPAKEQIHIESENSIDKIYIYDITGRVVLKEYMDEALSSYNLNIKQLASGVYNLKIYTESGIVYKKMIKE